MKKIDRSTSADSKISCEMHGELEYCLICQHLREGKRLNYFTIEAMSANQLSVVECDVVLEQEQGWSDHADEEPTGTYIVSCVGEALNRNVMAL